MFVLFFFPVFLLVIFGYAITFDVKHVKVAIADYDHSYESRLLISKIRASDYFDIVEFSQSQKEIDRIINDKKAQAVIVIPSSFSKDIYDGNKKAKLQFVIDGVDGNTATIIKNYLTLFTLNFSSALRNEISQKRGKSIEEIVEVLPRFQFNPDLESTKFLMPGLIALILIVTSTITVSLSLVKEKEVGTIEQLKVSSINSFELLTGKSLPYIVVSLINAGFVLAADYFFFGTTVAGSWWLLFLAIFIFVVASISMGVFVSTISDSQQIAYQISYLASFLPSFILSGFIFPIESMPPIIRIFAYLTPSTFFIRALRAIMLKGVGLPAFWEQLVYLLLFPLFFFTLSTLINRKKIREA